jgi:hypothetical protein
VLDSYGFVFSGIPHMNRRTSANFCAFPAFWQGRRVARTAAATWTARNGGEQRIWPFSLTFWTHSSRRLFVNA